MDIIRLESIELFAHHGAAPDERKLGQHFLVSVELYLDLTAAATSDALEETIDYAAVYETVAEAFTRDACQLLERAAWRVMEALFTRFDMAEVGIRVRKIAPPIDGHFDGAEVEFVRSREEVLGD